MHEGGRRGRCDSRLRAIWGGLSWVGRGGRAFFVVVPMTDEGASMGGGEREYRGEGAGVVWSWGGNQYWGEAEVGLRCVGEGGSKD